MTWSVPAMLARHALEMPEGTAIRDATRVISWAALAGAAASIAGELRRRGAGPGDRVAFLATPAADAVAILAGTLTAGAVAAPVPAGLTGRELDAALDVLAPKLVFALGPSWSGAWPSGDGAAAAGGDGATDDEGATGSAGRPAGEPDPEAPAVIVLTSGTTGRPKGVVLSSRALAASADAWLGALPVATGWAMPLGIAHVAGLGIVWRSVRERVPVQLLPPADADALLAALRAPDGPSHVSLVPGQLVRLLGAGGDAPAPHGVRAVLLGGGTIPPALVVRAADGGWPVVPTYGLSEMGSGVTALPAEEALEAPHSAGRPLPGMSVSIEGTGPDGVGEIVVRGPSRFSGYLGDVATGDAADPREPFRTGDMGRLDEAGRLVVVDRRTDRIVRGGENVDPGEVEAVLEAHPAVAEAAVVARPDETWGQLPVAAIVLRAGADDPGDEALTAHARAGLAGFKVPAAFARLDTLPRTTSGKLRRDAVRALLAGERTGELVRPDGDAIGWRVTGTGDRHLLLLHGTLSTSQQLDRLATALAAEGDLTVHAIDRRGSGTGRLAHPRPLDVQVHVDDLVAYLDARGIRRAAIAGVSFGGVLAIETAARRPDRVDAVAAYEPPYGVVADDALVAWFRRVAADTSAAHETAGPAAAAETFLRHVAGDAAWERLPERARTSLAREGDGALADAGLMGLDPDGLARISAPVLLLTGGASDSFYAPIADELARRIPTAERRTLDGLTHTSPITDATPVAAAIRAVLPPAIPTAEPPVETPR